MIDDEGVALAGDLEVGEKLVEERDLDRGPEDKEGPARQIMPDRNHHVRHVAEPGEDVADVGVDLLNVLEPLLAAVVDAGQVVRSDVAELESGRVDDAEIDESGEARLEPLQDLSHTRAIAEILDPIVEDDEVERSESLDERELDRELGEIDPFLDRDITDAELQRLIDINATDEREPSGISPP